VTLYPLHFLVVQFSNSVASRTSSIRRPRPVGACPPALWRTKGVDSAWKRPAASLSARNGVTVAKARRHQ